MGYNNYSEISNHTVPYYAKMGVGNDNNKLIENQLHDTSLEEQQYEKIKLLKNLFYIHF